MPKKYTRITTTYRKLLIMSTKKISVLYLDDEVENLNSFNANFRREFKVHLANSIDEAYQVIESAEIHVVLSDHKMPHITGIEFFETLCKTHPSITRVLLTGCSELNVVVDGVNRGQIYKYLYKPMNVDLVRKTVNEAYEKFLSEKKSKTDMVQLMETNEKLEFMLRQKLIS